MPTIATTDLVLNRREGFRLGPISLDLDLRGRTALIGPSGCGKTTLLRLLAGLEIPESGQITFDGKVATNGRRIVVSPADRRIGFVFQGGALWPHMTAVQHLRFVDPALSRRGATDLLETVGLGDLANRRPGAMSGGEQQRLALARALAGQPDILMLDEPFRCVDVHLRDQLALLIRRIVQEREIGLLVVTHDRQEALSMVDHVVIMGGGRVVEQGQLTDLLQDPKTAYGAIFLSQAVCLIAQSAGARIDTVFGSAPRPAAMGTQELTLALLPGDVVVATAAGPGRPTARVLHVLPTVDGAIATVELHGQSVAVTCGPGVATGDQLALELRRAPRFLPVDVDSREVKPCTP